MGKKDKRLLLFRDAFFNTILAFISIGLLGLIFFNINFFNPLVNALKDFSFLDVYYSEEMGKLDQLENDIILVNVAQEDRGAIANLLNQLLEADPKVIGVDVIFHEVKEFQSDSILAKVLADSRIVNSLVIQDGKLLQNHPVFRTNGSQGYVNFDFGTDMNVVREFEGLKEVDGAKYSSFAFEIFKKVAEGNSRKIESIGNKLNDSRVIRYYGNYNSFLAFDFHEINNLENYNFVKDKIVLVGYLGTPIGNRFDVEDKHFTPLNSITAGKSIPDMHGLVIHANILAMLLKNQFMYQVSFWLILAITFVLSVLGSALFMYLDNRLDISYRTVRKVIIFLYSIIMVGITLWLFKNGIVLKSAPILAISITVFGFIKYYRHLVRYINKRRPIRSYMV
ncbi:CHASE2 domain-containing protein [Zeaxanthinibacter sp. PT1]|uniref:CHASE2 domain-containing protein n=1 Tax=Zeaxanthinibacter TaxID=561554 RepID=UPI00234B99B4|nr:CHASE2 domain-containing protein [Zeaxanthinibacter sp. PT1]MDC6350492.1 CHASE2 domain-containing protein [Zeaxanthinibacter sp. PT1]